MPSGIYSIFEIRHKAIVLEDEVVIFDIDCYLNDCNI